MEKSRIKIILIVSVSVIIVAAVIAFAILGGNNDKKDSNSSDKDLTAVEEEQTENDNVKDDSQDEDGNIKEDSQKEDIDNSQDSQVSSGSSKVSGGSGSSEKSNTSGSKPSQQNKQNDQKQPSQTSQQKPQIQITGHVSYKTPTDCIYTQTYCDANGISIINNSDQRFIVKNNNVIGINVVMDEPDFVKLFNGDIVFVWGSEVGEYLDNLVESGEYYQSWGNTAKVPGNYNQVGQMVKSYDSIVPVDMDSYLKYYG